MAVLDLIGSALKLTGNILTFIQDSRGWKIQKKVENLIEEIRDEEKKPGHLKDDGRLDDLHDELRDTVQLFSSYLNSQEIPVKNI